LLLLCVIALASFDEPFGHRAKKSGCFITFIAAHNVDDHRGGRRLHRLQIRLVQARFAKFIARGSFQKPSCTSTIERRCVNENFDQRDFPSRARPGIRAGIGHLVENAADIDAAVLLVCDQPAVDAQAIVRLMRLRKTTKKEIIASSYANTLGVPALFGRSFFRELLSLRDRAGAKIDHFAKSRTRCASALP
jgi:CTP:molybdopterin cytidylyltransferase MocA